MIYPGLAAIAARCEALPEFRARVRPNSFRRAREERTVFAKSRPACGALAERLQKGPCNRARRAERSVRELNDYNTRYDHGAPPQQLAVAAGPVVAGGIGRSHEVKRYERDPKTMLAPPDLWRSIRSENPRSSSDGVTVAESGAIVEYLIDRYGGGRLIPRAGTPERLRYTYWLHYAEGSAMPPLLLKLVFDRVANAPAPWPISADARRIAGTVTGIPSSVRS